MYDFAFDKRTLGDGILQKDYLKVPLLADPLVKEATILQAVAISRLGFPTLPLQSSVVRGKQLYQFGQFHDELVVRKLSANVRHLTRVKQSDRETIIRSIKSLLEEGHNFRVYRLDIKSFYESISRSVIEDSFRHDPGFPPASLSVWKSFSDALAAQGISGMPRGMAVSAIISEYLLRDFDNKARRLDEVYYYSRYVDDIFIMTTAREDASIFKKVIENSLPTGLKLNHSKQRVITFDAPAINGNQGFVLEKDFDFLGYNFRVSRVQKGNTKNRRTVYLDIAKPKVAKLQTRIILSLRKYAQDGNFTDLRDRIKVISGNYNVYDRYTGHKRNVGIYFNYSLIDFNHSHSIKRADTFLKSILLAKAGKLPISLSTVLTSKQKRYLLSHSFARSFADKTFYHFTLTRLSELTECWAYA